MRLCRRTTASLLAVICLTAAPAALIAAPEPTYGNATPEAARAALNREQAENARRQLSENAINQQAYVDAQAAREAQIARDQEAWQAENTRLADEHEAAMNRWREDAAACRAGDRTRCKHR